MKKLLKFLFLSSQKKKLLGQSLIFLIGIRLSLWILPFKWLNDRLLGFGSNEPNSELVDWIVVNDVANSVRSCSRYVPAASCLTQALATRTLLLLRGQSSSLKIGVAKNESDKFMAHAWIEVNEKIIIGKLPSHRNLTVLNSRHSVVI